MSKIIKCKNYRWKGIEPRVYKDDKSCYKGVKRFSILGEREDEQQLNFQTRYFEVETGGYTTLEYHKHPHSVIVIKGSGSVILNDKVAELNLHDVIYISPESLHQFHADSGEPLGFLCIVDRYRDRPVLPDEEYLQKNLKNEVVLKKIKR